MRKLFIFLLAAAPLACPAQFIIKGTVRDSVNRQSLPGVTVIVPATNVTVFTDALGYFEIESKTMLAEVTFSFIGLLTRTVSLTALEEATIFLNADDEALLSEDHFIKASFSLGYFGDVKTAPVGLMMSMPIQSIGRVRLDLFPNFKYWNAQDNRGTEFSISKHVGYGSLAVFPDNMFVGYRSIAYPGIRFNLKQVRSLMVYELPGRFALDVGAAYSQLDANDVQRRRGETYFSGLLGLAKIFQRLRVGHLGLYANLNYNPSHTFYEVAAFHSFGVRKQWISAVIKYFDYEDINGVAIGLTTNIFSTRYYCCDSWRVHYDELSVLR